ncbi:hypothetical protein KVV02_004858 [Mortierella alpina]|uniref:C2 domain-containing protein n=1 Tax=Mortierella alpina TaxID=64518 RepID=A0A9P8AAL6_MORAP|nr:hypothetical protein KVV02_004858 [Mortierella alpina]
MLHSSHHGSNLEITVHSCHNLDDVERFGQNDAYVRLGFQLKKTDDFQKTIIKKGKNPSWEQIVVLRDLRPEYENLYVEVMDEEKGTDEIISYCAIPLSQIYSHQDQRCSAKFALFTPKSAQKGEISLTIRVLPLGQEAGSALTYEGSEKKGISKLDPEHEKRVKTLKLKESAEDAIKVAGTAAAVGAAVYGLFGDKKKAEGEKRDAALGQH